MMTLYFAFNTDVEGGTLEGAIVYGEFHLDWSIKLHLSTETSTTSHLLQL